MGLERMIVEEGSWRWVTTFGGNISDNCGFVLDPIANDAVTVYMPHGGTGGLAGPRIARVFRNELDMPPREYTDKEWADFVAFRLTRNQ